MFHGKLYEYEGELLSVKAIAGKVSLAPSTIYKYLNQGFCLYDAIESGKKQSSKVFQTRPKSNHIEAKKYAFEDGFYTVEEIAFKCHISKEPLYRRLKQGMSLEEAILEIQSHIAPKFPFMGMQASTYRIEALTGVPRWYLEKNLKADETYTEEEVEKIVSRYQKPDILMVGETSLLQYCIQNQLNYNAIYYQIEKNGLSIEEALNHYEQFGQEERFHYQYATGEILLYHFCIKEKIDDRYVKERLRKNPSIEEALKAAIFLSKEDYKTVQERNHLFQLYLAYQEDAISMVSLEDQEFIRNKHERIQEVLKEYRLYEALSVLPQTCSKEERDYVLASFDLTEEDIQKAREELFVDFAKISLPKKKGEVHYIWNKSN